jgi:PEGA domain
MVKFPRLGKTIRSLLVGGALTLASASFALAQHGGGGHGGGGGSHGGGGGYHGGGGSHGGGHVHAAPYHGYYGHGYYGGRYYGYGRYPGWGWGWGGWGWWGWPYWGWGWGYPYWGGYGYGYGAPGGYVSTSPAYSLNPSEWAAVKTDVSPDTTRVFLDGVFVGMTSDFEGPYLYVKKGEYQLEFRLDGFETKTVALKAKPGAVINISDKLKKVPGAKQYGSYENPEPEGGVQRFWSKEANTPVHPVDGGGGGVQGDSITMQDDGWRGAPQGQAPHSPQRPLPPTDEGESGETYAPPPPPPSDSVPQGRSRLVFHVQPADAAIYLNDHFVGTGEELSTLTRGLQIPPGQHTITISRPGMKSQERTVIVGPGKSETVDVTLQP